MIQRNDVEFWGSRFVDQGHTGWKNPIIYAYDQLERINVIKDALLSITSSDLTAIDFGSGSGDFSKLLLSLGYYVWGVDPYIHTPIDDKNYIHVKTLDSIASNSANFVLSITTMDHILDDNEFQEILSLLRGKIASGGHFFLIEYAVETENEVESSYQAFRTLSTWIECLVQANWTITSVKDVSHPIHAQSMGYLEYRRRPLIRIIDRLPAKLQRSVCCRYFLRKTAEAVLNKHCSDNYGKSPLKLFSCIPSR